jgi:hypothetical protein
MKRVLCLLFVIGSLFGLFCTTTLAEESALPVEPKITIRRSEEKTFYEYRVNGILKEIKVVPDIGPVYYLVPQDGGGWIEEQKSQLLVPKWVIFSW